MMRTHFLKEKIEAGFEDERKLLEHEPEKKAKLPALSYVRPILFYDFIDGDLNCLGNQWVDGNKIFHDTLEARLKYKNVENAEISKVS
ncbi:hypothetical protein ACN9TC_13630 [Lactococcus lactis]